jgi:hypothetical protein
MLGISNDYEAYCLDEACAVITQNLKDGKQIVYRNHYSKPSDLYKKYK